MGISSAKEYPEQENLYREWIQKNYHGEMDYLSRHASLKYNPNLILEGCQSLLFCGLNYHIKRSSWQESSTHGRIASYAYGRDYHKTFKKKLLRIETKLKELFPHEKFRSFTDTSPLDERFYAQKSGLGFIGKNDLLLSSTYGSFFFLGEILSTQKFEPSYISQENPHGACPVGCVRCFNNCPTGALVPNEPFKAHLCISYLTIEYKGSIPLNLREKIGDWIFGCDLCQTICPFNLRAKKTEEEEFLKPIAGESLNIKEVLLLKEEEFQKKFLGSPIKRTGREGLIRNACIVAGNIKDKSSLEILEKLILENESEIVKEHAQWAIKKILER